MGAPLAWAGLRSTVMVVAVSFRKASDPSYSSIVGAAEESQVLMDQFPRLPTTSAPIKSWHDLKTKKVRLTWDVCGHIQRGCRAKPFGGGCTYGELIRDPRVELWEEVVCGVGGQGHHQAGPLEWNRGIERAKTTVADLLEKTSKHSLITVQR